MDGTLEYSALLEENLAMKKAFPFLALIIIICAAVAEIIAIDYLNDKRVAKAAAFYEQSKVVTGEEKALLLLKSNVLAPSGGKREELINYFLEKGDFAKAEKYLTRDKSQAGLEKYAEAALENTEFTKAEKIINKISDTGTQDELQAFLSFAKGDYEAVKNLPKDPNTNTGRLLQALNTGTYTEKNLNSVLGRKIFLIHQKYQTKTAQLEIAKLTSNYRLYHVSLFLLNNLESEDSNLIELYVLKAECYAKLSNFKLALENQKKAIAIAPENSTLYKTAINYARSAANLNESNYLSEQLRYLELIQK